MTATAHILKVIEEQKKLLKVAQALDLFVAGVRNRDQFEFVSLSGDDVKLFDSPDVCTFSGLQEPNADHVLEMYEIGHDVAHPLKFQIVAIKKAYQTVKGFAQTEVGENFVDDMIQLITQPQD